MNNPGNLDPSNPYFLKEIKDLSINYQNDPGYRAFCQSIDKKLGAPYVHADVPDDLSDTGCVEVGSYLPCGRRAGDIKEGDEMILGDEKTFDLSKGIVSYSEKKQSLVTRLQLKVRLAWCARIPRPSLRKTAMCWLLIYLDRKYPCTG